MAKEFCHCHLSARPSDSVCSLQFICYFLVRSLLSLFLFVVQCAAADITQEERDKMSSLTDYDLKSALNQGWQALRDAREKGDKNAELRALMLLSFAWASNGETPSHADEE